jgi:uncharacterized membrane protein YhaH (DUF805 family)
MEWMLMPLKRYAEFSGRSRRKEYWMFTLGVILLYIVMLILMIVLGGGAMMAAATNPAASGGAVAGMGVFGIIFALVMLALIIPSLAGGVRRLHDTDRSGWWLGGLFGLAILYSVAGQVSSALALILGLAYLAMAITLVVFYCLEGTKGPNRYGEDPKGGTSAEVFA